jgi:hypothetical protein
MESYRWRNSRESMTVAPPCAGAHLLVLFELAMMELIANATRPVQLIQVKTLADP